MSLPLLSEHWSDFVGRDYASLESAPGARDGCFWLVVEVQRRMGYALPAPAADAVADGWEPVQYPEPGDAVTFKPMGDDAREHAAILLDRGRFLHAQPKTGVVVSPRIPAAQVTGYWRPRRTAALDLAREPGEPGVVTVRLVDSIAGERRVFISDPDTCGSFIPGDWAGEPEQIGISINGRSIPREDWGEHRVEAGSEVVIARLPGVGAGLLAALGAANGGALLTASGALTALGSIATTAINIALGIGLSFVSSLLIGTPQVGRREDREGSPTYNLDGIKNSIRPGGPIPVVYGEHVMGGQIIGIFFKVDSQGKSVLHMLLALSQGEIDSIGGLGEVDEIEGAAIPTTIKINGNPAANYRGVRISTRLGTSRQAIIPGFRGVTTAVPYSVTLDDGVAFLHTTSNRIDAFDINLFFPQGLVNINDEGDAGNRTLTYQVRWRRLGTTTWSSSGWQQIVRATQAPFSVAFNQANLVRDRYEIETTRIAPPWPETQADKVSTVQLNSVNEIVSDDLIYPNVALLGVRAIATDQLSGSIPTVTAKIRGKKVYVWDGISETAPTFTKQWSQSPPWIAYDILTNPYYGGGRVNNACTPKLSDFRYADLSHCQTLVSDGRGGTHQRGIANIVYDTTTRLWDAAQNVVSPFRMALAQVGDQIRLRVEQAASYSQLFTYGNMISGRFSFHYKNPKRVPNFIEVQYWNEELDFDPDVIQVEDQTSLDAGEPLVKLTMSVQGATHPARVMRAAKFRLLAERKLPKSISFEAAVDAVAVEAGDVIAIAHQVIRTGESGRLRGAADTSKIAMDRDAVITASVNDFILIRTNLSGSDLFQTGYLTAGTYAAGDGIPLVQSDRVTPLTLAEAAGSGDIYAFGPPTTYVKLWKVVSVQLTQRLTVKLDVVNYDASIYSDDPGTVPSATDFWPDPRTMPTAASSMRTKARYVRTDDGTVHPFLDLDFTTSREEECDVFIRRMDTA